MALRLAFILPVTAGSLLSSGCSDRDSRLAEAISAAEQSARRAELAAERAQAAANKATGGQSTPIVIEEPEDEVADAIEKANEPPSIEPESGV